MKFNKKVLVAMLAATCAIAGTVGLAACKDEKPTAPKVTIGDNGHLFVDGVDTGYEVKGEDVTVDYVLQIGNDVYVYYSNGTSQKIPYVNTNLSVGTNEINLANDALAKGITYKFAPNKAGKYVVIVSGDKAKVTIDDKTVDGSCVIELAGDNSDKEIKCATVDGKAGKFSVTVEPVKALSTTDATDITLPATGKTAYYSVSLAEAGIYTFDLGFSGTDSMADHNFTVNGKTYKIGGGWTTSFNASLNKGDNLISLTSALQADSTASLTLSKISIAGTLNIGDNNLTFENEDTAYAYTFTPAEDGEYTVTIPPAIDADFNICSTLKVETADGELLADASIENTDDDGNIISAPFQAKAGETVLLFVTADCAGFEKLDSYKLTITKFIPPTVSSDDNSTEDTGVQITVTETGSTAILNVPTAGTYTLHVVFGMSRNPIIVSLNGHEFNSQDEATLTLDLNLTAGENKISLVFESADYFNPSVDILVYLTAKA